MSFDTSASDIYRSTWRKIILVIIWGFQLAFLPINVIVLGLLISIARSSGYSYQSLNVVNAVLSMISLILIGLEIIMYQFRDLAPRFYLTSGIIKFILGSISVAMTAYRLSAEMKFTDWLNQLYLYFCLAFAVVIWITFSMALVFGIFLAARSTRRMKMLSQRYLTKQ